jgi:hypothetical protein
LTRGISFDSIVLGLPEAGMRKTQTLNLRVSPDFKRRLIEEARKAKRSVTNYIEVALSEYWTQKGSGDKRRANTKD